MKMKNNKCDILLLSSNWVIIKTCLISKGEVGKKKEKKGIKIHDNKKVPPVPIGVDC